MTRLRDQEGQLEAEIARLNDAIATGQSPPSTIAAIAEREKEIQSITNQLLEPGPGSLEAKLHELRTSALSRLSNLHVLLSKPETVLEARALLAEQVGKITLAPVQDNGRWSYTAKGSVDFFGDAAPRGGGAGGPSATERLPVSFDWLVTA